jgi:hypothetical protein
MLPFLYKPPFPQLIKIKPKNLLKELINLVKLQNLVTKCCKLYGKYSLASEVCIFCIRLYYVRKLLPFWAENAVTMSARNTNIYKICKLCKTIFSKFYNISQHFATEFCNFTNSIMFFLAVHVFDSLRFT